MGVSVKDVARLAGVSPMTVSNVVRGGRPVAAGTRARVEQAIATLGYRPNVSARRLRSGRSGIVALAVPRLDSPYFAELAAHVIKAAEQRGWTVLIDQTDGQREHERRVLAGIRDQLIDGVIFFSHAVTRRDLAERSGATPLVLLGDHGAAARADAVVVDNVAAGRHAAEHLLALGRRRLVAIGGRSGPHATDVERLRYKGFRLGAGELQRGVAAAPFGRAIGAEVMRSLLAERTRPDAVFCFNDLLALGALHVALGAGLAVPDDLAILGFDDIEDGRYSNPTLSTIAPDKAEIAATAVALLERRMAGGPDLEPVRHVAGHRLLARGTTAGSG